MIRNYFKIAWRNIRTNKVYFFVNSIGLTIGLSTFILISLFVLNDLNYDRHQSKSHRIGLFQQFMNSSSSGSLFKDIIKNQTGVESLTQISPSRALVGKSDFASYEDRFCFADSNLLQVFEFPMIEGSLNESILAPHKVAISEKMAKKYFKNNSPIGQILKIQLKNESLFEVVGIMQNSPPNTHLEVDFICSFANKKELNGDYYPSYWDLSVLNYILLKEGYTFGQFKSQLPEIIKATNDENSQVWRTDILPLQEIYLNNRTDDKIKATKAIDFVKIFSLVAIAILLLACFNYLNLSLATSNLRGKEIGVRKVSGALQNQLVKQFMGETFLITFFSSIFALILVHFSLPFFSTFADQTLHLSYFFTPSYITMFFGFILLVSFISGLYPAFILSNLKPSTVLKKGSRANGSLSFFRKGLVTFQFGVSVLIIFATLVVFDQLSFLQNKDLGYSRENILTLNIPSQMDVAQRTFLKNELRRSTDIESVTDVSILPGKGISFNKADPSSITDKEIDPTVGLLFVDPSYDDVFGVKVAEGRFFKENSEADKSSYVINQKAAETFSWKVGQNIGYMTYESSPDGSYREVPVNGVVLGIVKDYNQMDLKSEIFPLILSNRAETGTIALKLSNKNLEAGVENIGQIWKNNLPNFPYEYEFLDQIFDYTYKKETKTLYIFGLFAVLTIFISCLGLFGLVTFATQQRIKEIGIRKILGSSVYQIIGLLTKDFSGLLIISLLLAFPIGYWAMNTWLQDFKYRVNISWQVYAISGAIILFISFLTISLKSINAALENPVKSLRSE